MKIQITNRGEMWRILADGKTVGFAATYRLARAMAEKMEAQLAAMRIAAHIHIRKKTEFDSRLDRLEDGGQYQVVHIGHDAIMYLCSKKQAQALAGAILAAAEKWEVQDDAPR